MTEDMGETIIPGGDAFWKTKAENIQKLKDHARWAAITSDIKNRCKNLARMKTIVNLINSELEKHALIMYPLTPQKCGFKGTVASFHELTVCILKNPDGVSRVEKWEK